MQVAAVKQIKIDQGQVLGIACRWPAQLIMTLRSWCFCTPSTDFQTANTASPSCIPYCYEWLVIWNLVMPDSGQSKSMLTYTIGDDSLPGEGGDTYW
jgi:hypothetical protein